MDGANADDRRDFVDTEVGAGDEGHLGDYTGRRTSRPIILV